MARQHPRGRDGTVFVTIEDETGDVQVIVWRDLFARRRRELWEPGRGGYGPRVEMGRDHEHHRDGRACGQDRGDRARLPQLALTFIPVYRDCAGIVKRFMINARCVADIA